MSNGIWNGTAAGETLLQSKLTRHRLLVVSVGTDIGLPWSAEASSGFASLDPNTISPDTHNPLSDRGPEGGPHFVMSGETPDESHTYGFEFSLFTKGLNFGADPGAGGYTVTVWVLISNTQDPMGAVTPVWAAMAPNTGVAVNEMWHSFDVNAEAIRFQIGNLAVDPATANLDVGIAFAEL